MIAFNKEQQEIQVITPGYYKLKSFLSLNGYIIRFDQVKTIQYTLSKQGSIEIIEIYSTFVGASFFERLKIALVILFG